MPLLEVKNINQFYGGSHILRDVSFEARLGRISVLLGRNGVGKTTLLKSLMGAVPIRDGSITFNGASIERAAPYERARAGIGYVPQGRRVWRSFSQSSWRARICCCRKVCVLDRGQFAEQLIEFGIPVIAGFSQCLGQPLLEFIAGHLGPRAGLSLVGAVKRFGLRRSIISLFNVGDASVKQFVSLCSLLDELFDVAVSVLAMASLICSPNAPVVARRTMVKQTKA